MPEYSCNVTETRGSSWANPGTSTTVFNYTGSVNMDGYSDSAVDSTRVWSCKKK